MIEEKTRVPNRKRQYELIDKDGICVGTFASARMAFAMAKTSYPNQEQDPERNGKGWTVQEVGNG